MQSYAIVGSGYTGISILAHLLDIPVSEIDCITLFDTPANLAMGIAFSEDVSTNLLNRPVSTMYFSKPGDFSRWLGTNVSGEPVKDDEFIPRMLFGQFLRYQLHQCQKLAAQRGITLKIVPQLVADIIPVNNKFRIKTIDSTSTVYDRCFLCLGTATNNDPYGLINQAGYYDSIWPLRDLEISDDDSVAIIGSRLSAHDAAIALAPRCRKIYFVSRKGELPRQISGYHNLKPQVFTRMEINKLAEEGKVTIAQLFNLLRKEFTAQKCSLSEFIQLSDPSVTAMSILLALNNNMNYAWQQLNEKQRKHFILRWQTRWQQLRIPIASPNAQKVTMLFSCGKLEHIHGDVTIKPLTEGFKISVPGSMPVIVDKIINASGISNAPESYPLVQRLMQRGLAVAHPLGGIKVYPDSLCLLNAAGEEVPGIKCIGQLTVGEYYVVSNIDVLHSQARQAVESLRDDATLSMTIAGE